MKTKEELTALKEEVETLNKKLHELTEEELAQVIGGGPKLIPSPLLRLQTLEDIDGVKYTIPKPYIRPELSKGDPAL